MTQIGQRVAHKAGNSGNKHYYILTQAAISFVHAKPYRNHMTDTFELILKYLCEHAHM